jgi:hypothetical protein
MEIKNPIAELDIPDSGRIIRPFEATALKKANHRFFCPDHDCQDPFRKLFLAKSGKGTLFFKHGPGYEHDIRPETLLHKLAVKWFENRLSIVIPDHREEPLAIASQLVRLCIEETKCEYRKLQGHIPDVLLVSTKGFKFAIEVVVTSDINDQKVILIKDFGFPTIRIDLGKFYMANQEQCRTDYDFILANLDNLLSDIKSMSWVIPPKLENLFEQLDVIQIPIAPSSRPPAPKPITDNTGCLFVILTFGFILLFK